MSRPLRIEFPDAVYHVTTRGNGGQAIFGAADDAARFLELLGREIAQQRWLCHGFCLLEDHYHLLIETPEPNLGRGMARLNMRYSQWFNRQRGRIGHVFAGRYKAILVEKGPYLLALARHLALNPVRLGAVNRADQWRWSHHRALALGRDRPDWLHTAWIAEQMGDDEAAAQRGWAEYVAAGIDAPSPWQDLRGGQYLGSAAFLRDMARRLDGRSFDQVSRAARRPDRPDAAQVTAAVAGAASVAADRVLDRNAAPEAFRVAVYLLRRAANLPLKQVADMAGVSPGRISQIQRSMDEAGGAGALYAWAAELDALAA